MKVAIHLGLGDAIVCAAIIAKLASENEVVEIPCWKHNEVSVKSFFVNYPNVVIEPFKTVEDYNHWALDADLKLGHYGNLPQLPNEDFVQWFYRQAGMDIEEKEKWCPILEASKKCFEFELCGTGWDLIHDDELRGFKINDKNIHSPTRFGNDKSKPILTFATDIGNAETIHCIDSSFLHLVECLPTTGKLFYHKYARPDSPDYKYLKKEWTILN